jgi:hypothetical protein
MAGPNRAPLILLATILAGAGAFAIAQQSNPQDVGGKTAGTAAMIVVAIGIAFMVVWQRRWVAEARPEPMLVELALNPGDARTLQRVTGAHWDITESSVTHGMWITLLILALMVPAWIAQDPTLMVFGAVPIVAYALFLAVRTVMPGGTYAKAMQASDDWLAVLGLEAVERPTITLEPRLAGAGAQVRMRGPSVFEGTRHGRQVRVVVQSGRCRTTVSGSAPTFEARGHHQRLRGEGDVPAMLADVKPGPHWTSMKLSAGPDGIAVQRKSGTEPNWLYDLWLAEKSLST